METETKADKKPKTVDKSTEPENEDKREVAVQPSMIQIQTATTSTTMVVQNAPQRTITSKKVDFTSLPII